MGFLSSARSIGQRITLIPEKPEIKAGFTGAPEVAYSPTRLPSPTKIWPRTEKEANAHKIAVLGIPNERRTLRLSPDNDGQLCDRLSWRRSPLKRDVQYCSPEAKLFYVMLG
jgi:hypothetical protein